MSAKRIKAPSLPDRAAFLAAVDEVATLATQIAVLKARRDRAVQRVQAAFAAKLSPLEDEQAALTTLAEKFAVTYRSDLLPKDRKSVDTGVATYGFRTGNPTVRTIGKAAKWEGIVATLTARKLVAFLRTVVEVNKEALLAAWRKADGVLVIQERTEEEPEKVIAPEVLGLRIGQTETFFIEARVETATPVKAA